MKARIKDPKYEGDVFECELAPQGFEYLLTMEGGEKVLFDSSQIEVLRVCEGCNGEGTVRVGDGYSYKHTICGLCDGEGHLEEKKKFHVHVYRVVKMVEVDVEAPNEEVAMTFALRRTVDLKEPEDFPNEPDCKKIAIPFDVTSDIKEEE